MPTPTAKAARTVKSLLPLRSKPRPCEDGACRCRATTLTPAARLLSRHDPRRVVAPCARVNILRRYPKTFIALALAVVIVVLTVAVIIPQVTSGGGGGRRLPRWPAKRALLTATTRARGPRRALHGRGHGSWARTAIVGRYVEDSSIEMDELEILDVFEQVANIHLKCTHVCACVRQENRRCLPRANDGPVRTLWRRAVASLSDHAH